MRARYSDLWQALGRALPERPALVSADGRRWTYAEFSAEAGALAHTLTEAGIGPGDRVAIPLHNRPEFLVAFFACLGVGAFPVPMNYRFRAIELTELLDDSDAAAIIFPASAAATVGDAIVAARRRPFAIHVADLGDGSAPGISWRDAVAQHAPLPDAAPDGGELWIYTGGTTGRPKAVRWDVEDMFEAQMVPTYTMSDLTFPETPDDAVGVAADPRTPRVVNLPLAPFIHGTALTTSLNTLVLGGTVLVTSSATLDAAAALALANEHGATRLIVAGDAIAVPLADAADASGIQLPTVTLVQSSGMRFSPETKRRLHALGEMTIFDMLASTEGGLFAVTATTGVGDLPGRPRLVPTATVLDREGREVQDKPGSVGVLAQRGALPLGYHGDEQKTRETFPMIDGLRHVIPGDWVRVLDNRHIEFLGRGGSVINTGGEKVYPQEVEDALLSHPGVRDAAVIGVEDPRFGEIVAAVVARRDPELTADALVAHVAARLAGYKKPRLIVFRDSLERTPTGKVVVGRLRDEVVRLQQRGSSR